MSRQPSDEEKCVDPVRDSQACLWYGEPTEGEVAAVAEHLRHSAQQTPPVGAGPPSQSLAGGEEQPGTGQMPSAGVGWDWYQRVVNWLQFCPEYPEQVLEEREETESEASTDSDIRVLKALPMTFPIGTPPFYGPPFECQALESPPFGSPEFQSPSLGSPALEAPPFRSALFQSPPSKSSPGGPFRQLADEDSDDGRPWSGPA